MSVQFVPRVSDGLFAVQHTPERAIGRTGIVILNAGLMHRVGPYRLFVQLGERLASTGVPVVRVDQAGKGDSPVRRGQTLAASIVADVQAAKEILRAEFGCENIIVGGLCSGADDALHASLQVEGVVGLFMLDGYSACTPKFYLKRYSAKLFSPVIWRNRFNKVFAPKRRASAMPEDEPNLRNWGTKAEMLANYHALLDKGVSIFAAFTADAHECYAYSGQFVESLRHQRAADLVQERFFAQSTHLFPLQEFREPLLADLSTWLQDVAAARQV